MALIYLLIRRKLYTLTGLVLHDYQRRQQHPGCPTILRSKFITR